MRGKGEGSVFKDSRGLWNGVIELPSPDGGRRQKRIRRKNKSDLLNALRDARNELARTGDLPTRSDTVEQWFTYWLRQVATEVRPNTLDGYRRTVHNHIIPAIGKTKLDKLTAQHIRRVHDAITTKGLSTTTALLAHRTMSVSFKMAVREGRIGRNPANLVKAPRKAATQLDALTLEEAVTFLEVVMRTSKNGPLWATALLTGARRGEVIGLERDRVSDVLDLSWQIQRIRWRHGCGGACHAATPAGCPQRKTDDVPADYEKRHIKGGLYWTRPKSSKSWRIIPLLDPLKSILEKHLASTPDNEWGLVFLRKGEPFGPDLASKDWRADLAAAGIEKNIRLHDVRHTTVDLLYAAGIPEDLIMSIVGHSTRTTTRGYQSAHNRERLLGAMTQFSELFTPPSKPEVSAASLPALE